jgi:hypothetical protein
LGRSRRSTLRNIYRDKLCVNEVAFEAFEPFRYQTLQKLVLLVNRRNCIGYTGRPFCRAISTVSF